jgi:RNA polymerase sigma factor (TIGR02999 family)
MGESGDITELLQHWQHGDRQVLSKLADAIYPELRIIAASRLKGQGPDATIEPTDLLHEAWLRLSRSKGLVFQHRGPFYAAVAVIMRNILVDRARAKKAAKRTTVEDWPVAIAASSIVDVIEVDRALGQLELVCERQARLVELRYFAGCTADETAEALGVSLATVKRDWIAARMFIKRCVEGTNV